jgi:ribulose-5-phosphate 4-epimerase/fuculose-1-phosphate aldolase
MPGQASLQRATAAIIEAGRRMDRFNRVPATAGNISVRLPGDEGLVAITRSGGHKGFLDPSGVMVVDLDGRPRHTDARPSAETGLHCGIYRRFRDAGAVLHGHLVASYAAIAAAMGLPPGEVLFLSDVAEELDAAAAAGMRSCQPVRAADGTRPSGGRHAEAADFPGVARLSGLPAP